MRNLSEKCSSHVSGEDRLLIGRMTIAPQNAIQHQVGCCSDVLFETPHKEEREREVVCKTSESYLCTCSQDVDEQPLVNVCRSICTKSVLLFIV